MGLVDNFLTEYKNLFLNEQNKIFVLVGPTATGKTSFAVQLAKKIDAEIINCDMAQIYSEVKIGTGQIKDVEKEGIEHYLFGFLTEPFSISVYEMRQRIEAIIKLILLKNKKVLLVGGSSFCIYSLFFAPLACVSKLMIAPFGRVASEVFYFSNEEKKDKDVIVFSPFFHYTVIFYDNYLVHKKLWLDGIKKRIDIFFLEGWLEEIRGLSDSWRSLLMQKKFIGYNELIPFVDFKNGFEMAEIKELIFFRTCQYGKKQRTFLRKMKRDFLLYEVSYKEWYF